GLGVEPGDEWLRDNNDHREDQHHDRLLPIGSCRVGGIDRSTEAVLSVSPPSLDVGVVVELVEILQTRLLTAELLSGAAA
ncbi:MAG: hypothetical protein ACKO3P_03385, partial [Planctomycetaceae bacterium]